MTRRSVNRAAIAGLNESILAELQAGPQTADALSAKLGVASSTIRGRLALLSEDGRVRSTKDRPNGQLGARNTWRLGDSARADSPAPAVIRRDPLVAALFGPAHQASA